MESKSQDSKPCACPYCDEELEAAPMPFCEECGKEIKVCKSCGCALAQVQNVCPSCGVSQE